MANDNALKINENDNVVIATRDIGEGEPVIVGGERLFTVPAAVAAGHKIALVEIRAGENVVRYGEPIVRAVMTLCPGEWVHTHNTKPIS